LLLLKNKLKINSKFFKFQIPIGLPSSWNLDFFYLEFLFKIGILELFIGVSISSLEFGI